MKYLFYSLLFLLLSPLLAAAQTQIELDVIERINLSEGGPALIEVKTDRPGVLRADIFSTKGLTGAINITHAKPDPDAGDTTPTLKVGQTALPKGTHRIQVSSANNQAGSVQIRFLLDPALDIYEPNNSLSTAHPITPPFQGLVRVSAGDEDWYKIDVPKGHVIGVNLRTRSDYTGPVISFHKADGTVLYESQKNQWGHRGMRYYRSEGDPVFIKVIDTYNWRANDVRAFRLLDIDAYAPNPDSANLFVKIDMNASGESATQIDYVSEAVGSKVASATDASDISTALNSAIEDNTDTTNWPRLLIILALLALACLGGWMVYKRTSSKPDNVTDAPPEDSPNALQSKAQDDSKGDPKDGDTSDAF